MSSEQGRDLLLLLLGSPTAVSTHRQRGREAAPVAPAQPRVCVHESTCAYGKALRHESLGVQAHGYRPMPHRAVGYPEVASPEGPGMGRRTCLLLCRGPAGGWVARPGVPASLRRANLGDAPALERLGHIRFRVLKSQGQSDRLRSPGEVGPAMDGEFPQHEPPPAGSVLCSPPPLESPLCGSSVQNTMLHCQWWSPFQPTQYPAFSSDSPQLMNSASFLVNGPHCLDTSYGPEATPPSFLPKTEFPQESAYLGELSPNSIFSSSVDSLSDIADTPDFLPADSLSQVPTIWDVNTGPPVPDKLFPPSGPFAGLEDPVHSLPSTPLLVSYQSQSQPEEEDEAEEEEAEELGHAETYADYVPSKSKIGKQHPDRVVETSTLSSVPPPDITYSLALPASDSGALSALQLEAITYACQQHEVLLPSGQRAGFLIGDGAGVGKGRTVAGIIFENYLRGRKKSLWFSVSNDLKYDAERDLRDIEAPGISVHALSKVGAACAGSPPASPLGRGLDPGLKTTGTPRPPLLVCWALAWTPPESVRFCFPQIKYGDNTTSEGILFATYSSLIGESQAGGQHRTRIRQILEWCGEAFDGVVS
ncbi:Protein strawberry notch-2 [Galemys pyrenaicus]|uniref:Protein strawberry notch-2 n=1 Tax=Galemys pyrenaicus TaxID=202257 RepID=A0A8J6DSI0_GALPY|nr:Protein strawberry notch-2 [Galemys pyrenaicus]